MSDQPQEQPVAFQIHAPRRGGKKKIDFLNDDKAFQAALMGALGFSYKAISASTGLNHAEINYRLKLRKIKLKSYRDGVSPFSKLVMARTEKLAAKQLALQIEE